MKNNNEIEESLQINVIQEDTNPVSFTKKRNGKKNHLVSKEVYEVNASIANGDFLLLQMDSFSIVYGDFDFCKAGSLHFQIKNKTAAVKLLYTLSGRSSWQINNSDFKPFFNCNQHNIVYVPAQSESFLESSVCKDCNSCLQGRFLEINLTPQFFEKYLLGHNPAFEQFKKNIEENNFSCFCPNNLNISLQMHEVIQEMIKLKVESVYEKLFLESKVLQLLSLQFEQFENYSCPALYNIKATDLDKIYKAREILLEQLENPCPLVELALKVGTNECTLKKGFKEVFGCTVFGYLQDVRMQQAKKCLFEGAKSISEIADELGYKNATHFTSAFKKKFGVLPSKVRK